MKRELSRLASEHFDIVIVGSGIHGAVLAHDAAKAGYKIALLDKGDFGHSTSANSLKIIHGGIRYLQHGDLKRMRESILSRRSMMRFAPHIVKPLACLMPTYGHGIKGREMMRLALGIYDLVAFDRNRGLERNDSLPCGTSLSVDKCKQVVPGIKEQGLTGGAVWHDAMAHDTERLNLLYVKEASKYGGCVANYTEALSLLTIDDGVAAVVARDLASGREFRLNCSVVVNAAGPWLSTLSAGDAKLGNQQWATAINIIVKKKLFKKYAVGLEGVTDFTDKDAIIKRGKRLFFFVPWKKEYTMIGTTYKPYSGEMNSFSVDPKTVLEVLGEINGIYPDGNLGIDDVSFVHAGLLPMNEADKGQADSVQLDKSSKVIDHGKVGGVERLVSIKGVKYTTAPDIAARVLRLIAKRKLLPAIKKAGTYQIKGTGCKSDFGPLISLLGDQYPALHAHLRDRYGSEWREVFSYLVSQGVVENLWVNGGSTLLVAELFYFIKEEMATSLSDVVFRRSGIGSAECPSRQMLSAISEIMGRQLGWDSEEKKSQIEEVLKVFAPLEQFYQ
jgi:glycerol-3-phosphate dehydrogenase